VSYCLKERELGDLQYVVFYDQSLMKLEGLIEAHLVFAQKGLHPSVMKMPMWLKEKLLFRDLLAKEFIAFAQEVKISDLPQLLFGEHHDSHATSAFYLSPL
jgi:carbamoyltransferase